MTTLGLVLSFTPVSSVETFGASRVGYLALYPMLTAIGAQADLKKVLEVPMYLAVGVLWISIHIAILILVAKLIRAPLFFVATGSMANIGGPVSAPVVASVFHPALAPVGVLMGVTGYIIGIYGSLLCAWLLALVATALVANSDLQERVRTMTIRVMHVGLGPIGVGVLKQVMERPGFEVVAAVDIDPEKAGKDVGEILGLEDKTGVVVQSDLKGALPSHDADVVALCTGSTLPGIKSQLEAILAARLPVVSTTEELSFPQFSNEALTEELDKLARDAGVAVVVPE